MCECPIGHRDAPPLASNGVQKSSGHSLDTSNNAGVSQISAEGPVSRILSCAVIPLDAASPRTFISDLPGGSGNCSSRLGASGRHATQAWLLACASLPIWSCSVWGLPCPWLYSRGGALLPHHFTLTPAPSQQAGLGSPSTGSEETGGGVAEAVSFLWHWPSTDLEVRVPDVIRHTALRSSDFPPPAARFPKPPAATARSSCQG